MTAKPRVLCCANNRAAVADAYSVRPSSQISKAKIMTRIRPSETRTIDLIASRPPLDKEQIEPRPSLFRERSDVLEEMEDLLTLKRATPVYDSEDDEADEYISPLKRSKRMQAEGEEDEITSAGEQILMWSDCLVEDEFEGFILSPSIIGAH